MATYRLSINWRCEMKPTYWVVSISMLALKIVVSCGADNPQLKLRGKTITIYPVLLRQLDQEESVAQVWRHGPGIAENLGVSLEQWGMLPRISAEEFRIGIAEENLTESVKKPDAFPDKPAETDYVLILLFEVKEAEKKPLVRAQAAMTDSSGQVVWSQQPDEFSSAGNMWPISLYQQIANMLLSASDLDKPDTKPSPGPLETRAREKHEAKKRK